MNNGFALTSPTCMINDRVCTFIVDSGSCRNVISDEAVTKLGLAREKHPSPYTLGWLNDSATVRISERALVFFSIGPHYKDRIYCDIAPMDISHLLLGRPWEFDRKVMHSGADNTYQFMWNNHIILLLPSKETVTPLTSIPKVPSPAHLPSKTKATLLCLYKSFKSELKAEGMAFALLPSPITKVFMVTSRQSSTSFMMYSQATC